ncbi:uncharacterized protein LOC133173654 [Saccostrea echinata]|uniref:uncharacterized protein LOC133173654 n=1 Tax=Saccostrea echinata TaxID=191078 RepID=UPI002A80C507|nr:uncharacterized protein LOC133173654 [Saccostrea echinata]
MSGIGKVLQGVVGLVAQKKYHLLTREMIQNAKADLNNLLKGVVGAQADNVESLRAALKAAEEKDWDKLDMVLVDAQIDYTTLLKALKKGYRPVPRTVESKKFTGIHDLMDVPTELDSLTRASKTFVVEKQEQTDEVNTERYLNEDERPAETAQQENQSSLIEIQQKEIEELKIRLSKLEEEKLGDKNSTFTNLSDTNRPTNLAERFSELYDNEWTKALEDLRTTKENHEDGNIKLLADILEAAFQYCKTLASDQFQDMWEKILFPMKNVPEWLHVTKKLQKEASRCLKEFRKDHGVLSIPSIQMMFSRKQLSKMIDPDLHTDNLVQYTNLCIELSWLFNIQDPPMCLLWAHEGQRVSEHLRLYSGKGKTVSYNVWPSLLLHEGGPLLKKGVVQPHSN